MLTEDIELVEGDVTRRESLVPALDRCDVVYHAAGFPEQWMKDASVFEQVNLGGTRNLIDVAMRAGIRRFVYTSTIDVL